MIKALLTFALVSIVSAAEQWARAEIQYGHPEQVTPVSILLCTKSDCCVKDLREFLKTQPHIKKVHNKDIQQAQLHMFKEEDDTKSSETLFATYVPISMVKDILKDKKLLDTGYTDL